MSEAQPGDERVEELLRVNERLAAEVRNLSLRFADRPRPEGMPTSRRRWLQSASFVRIWMSIRRSRRSWERGFACSAGRSTGGRCGIA